MHGVPEETPSGMLPGRGVSSVRESGGIAARPAGMLRLIVFVFMAYFIDL